MNLLGMIDWSFRFGDVMVIMSFLGTIGMFIYRGGRFTRAIESMQEEISALKKVAESVAGVLTAIAVQKIELEHVREDIKEIKLDAAKQSRALRRT